MTRIHNVGIVRWRRLGNPLRVYPDVLAHKLSDRGLLPHLVQAWACALRGLHGFRYRF